MTGCNATLTTATVTNETVDQEGGRCPSSIGGNRCLRPALHDGRCRYGTADHHRWKVAISDGVTVQRQGDRLVRVDLHTLTCVRDAPHGPEDRHFEGQTSWTDDTPDATPHVDPAVTDAEVDAALKAYPKIGQPGRMGAHRMRQILEAAAEVRQGGPS